jgi:hypothetical protein
MDIYSPGRQVIVTDGNDYYSNAFGDKIKSFFGNVGEKIKGIDLSNVGQNLGGILGGLTGGLTGGRTQQGGTQGMSTQDLMLMQQQQAEAQRRRDEQARKEKQNQTLMIVGIVGGVALIGIIAFAASRKK